jgi:hypothetical protein
MNTIKSSVEASGASAIKFRGQGESLSLSQDSQRVHILKILESSESVESLLERLKKIESQGITPYSYCDNCLLNLVTGELISEEEDERENVVECIYLSALQDGSEDHPGNIWNLPCLLVVYEGDLS